MEYTFSPATDFARLEAAVEGLCGPQAAPRQLDRYRSVLRGLEETFGPCERAAVFSAPGRSEIGGNHTDHQHGRVLAGSIDLDVIAAVAPSGDGFIRIQSEGFPMDVVDLGDLSTTPPPPSSGALPPGSSAKAAPWRASTPAPPPASSRAAA